MSVEEPHKRYLVFGTDTYYPLGGMSDCIDSFDTLEEAKNCVENSSYDCTEIYDRLEGVTQLTQVSILK